MKNWKIYLDNQLQKEIELKADFSGVSSGSHEVKIEAYEDTTFLDTKIKNVTVISAFEAETEAFMQDSDVSIPNDSTIFYSGTSYEATGANLWTVIDDFIKREKAAGRWSNILYFRPRVKGTALGNSVNLTNPSLFRGTHFGSWVHNGGGSEGNGSNTYMSTGFTASEHQTAGASGQGGVLLDYSVSSGYPVIMGSYEGNEAGAMLYAPRSSSTRFSARYNGGYESVSGGDVTNSRGVQLVNRVGSISKIIHNGIEVHSFNGSGSLPTSETHEGASIVSEMSGYLDGRLGSTYQVKDFSLADAIGFTESVEQLEIDLKRKNW